MNGACRSPLGAHEFGWGTSEFLFQMVLHATSQLGSGFHSEIIIAISAALSLVGLLILMKWLSRNKSVFIATPPEHLDRLPKLPTCLKLWKMKPITDEW